MRAPYTQLYVHLTWSTWDRLPLITKIFQSRLYASIASKCRQLKCEPLAIGGMEDHMQLLVRLHPTVAVATLVKEAKGTSSHLVTHEITPGEFFKWQGGYGAFTIRKEDVLRLKAYIENQVLHHAKGSLQIYWELIKKYSQNTRILPLEYCRLFHNRGSTECISSNCMHNVLEKCELYLSLLCGNIIILPYLSTQSQCSNAISITNYF